jgi:uncharacterized protein (DUF2267 family)
MLRPVHTTVTASTRIGQFCPVAPNVVKMMSTTGLEIFDRTLHETHRWLKIVMEELETADRKVAFAALRATLHALRDRIGPMNAIHLAAQFPMLLRGAYYEGWRPTETPTGERHASGFIAHVGANLAPHSGLDPEEAAQASLIALTECLDPGEVKKIAHLLPADVRTLLPDYAELPEPAVSH